MTEVQLDAALDLLRRLSPSKISQHLTHLTALVPDMMEDLLSLVDQPLKISTCPLANRQYLICDYNRDASSYRSPWSNEYNPPCPDGLLPSSEIRALEVAANDAFDTYRELYYEGGISSVYMWDLEGGFASVVLIKKATEQGCWDSIHVIEVVPKARSAHYKLTSTIMLQLASSSPPTSEISLCGNITRQAEHDVSMEEGHVVNMGRLVEDMEYKLRNSLSEIYFGKTLDIANDLRGDLDLARLAHNAQSELVQGLHTKS